MPKLFEDLQNKQQILSSIIGGAVIMMFLTICWFAGIKDLMATKAPTKQTLRMVAPGMNIDNKNAWMNKIETKTNIQEKKLETLEGAVLKGPNQELQEQIVALKEEIELLKNQIENKPNNSSTSKALPETFDGPKQTSHEKVNNQLSNNQQQNNYGGGESFNSQEVGKVVLNLSHNAADKKYLYKDFIPAGSFMKAVILDDISVNCGINGVSDPEPVNMRILDDGSMPNNYASKLKRCRIIGAARGNLATESVSIRLERLSCIDEKGRVVETEVAGYVKDVNNDKGKGLRGEVLDKTGSMMSKVALSGFLSGVSDFLSSNYTQNRMQQQIADIANQGARTQLSFNVDSLKAGTTKGASNAFDKLADYYIKRAEQLQPAIHIRKGVEVKITFTHGVKIGDKNTRRNIEQSRKSGAQ